MEIVSKFLKILWLAITFSFGIIDGTACLVVVIARLSDRAHCDEIFFAVFKCNVTGGDIGDGIFGQCEGLGQVGVSDKCDVIQFIEVRQKLVSLFEKKDVIEFLRFDG